MKKFTYGFLRVHGASQTCEEPVPVTLRTRPWIRTTLLLHSGLTRVFMDPKRLKSDPKRKKKVILPVPSLRRTVVSEELCTNKIHALISVCNYPFAFFHNSTELIFVNYFRIIFDTDSNHDDLWVFPDL